MNDDTCPKCGAAEHSPKSYHWHCDSQFVGEGGLLQSDKCRIRELEAENRQLHEFNAGLIKVIDDAIAEISEHIKLTDSHDKHIGMSAAMNLLRYHWAKAGKTNQGE